MKNILFLLAMICAISCSKPQNEAVQTELPIKEISKIDSISEYFSKIDSAYNCGKLYHLNVHEIEKFKQVQISVYDIKQDGEHLYYIQLRKDVGNDYYYNWEEVRILSEEVKYMRDATNIILSNLDRTVENEERYIYITKDDFRLYSARKPSDNKWETVLDMDYLKNDSKYYVHVDKEGLSKFMDILEKADKKIQELKEAEH